MVFSLERRCGNSHSRWPGTELQGEVGGQAVLGRQDASPTPWLTERYGYDPTWGDEAVAFGLVEPLNGAVLTIRHGVLLGT